LRHAFAEARRHSERVLIERHVDGRDFRLTCFEGNLIGAVERVPGGVLGDGRSSVAELVERLNADPERGNRFTATLKKLKFDVEAEEQLAAAGLTAASIPRKGQWVRLRGPANLARGGSRIDVMDQVHPDNRRLAEQAARALRLDIAGVDLITPDIGRSWLEGGVHLTEVNAQPDLLTTLPRQTYGLILERLIAGEGRIPIGVILGGGTEAAASELAARILGAAGLCVGVASASGTLIGEERFGQKTSDVAIAARALLGDTRVEACVVSVTDASVGRSGLPFDRCGVVALAGSSLEQGSSWRTIAEPLLPMSRGLIAINAEDEQCVALSPGAGAARVILYARAPDCPALVAHRAAGGPAVWLQGSEVAIQTGAGAAVTLQLGGADAAFGASLGDILLAVAVAGSLGCGEQQLRQALAQVRLEA